MNWKHEKNLIFNWMVFEGKGISKKRLVFMKNETPSE